MKAINQGMEKIHPNTCRAMAASSLWIFLHRPFLCSALSSAFLHLSPWNPSCYREDYKEEHTANQAFVHTKRTKLSYCLVDYLLASVVMHIWRPFQMSLSVATESFLRTNTLTNWPMKTGFGCWPWPNIHLNFILASAHNARIRKGWGAGGRGMN